MSNEVFKPEILAPAGSLDAFEAALNSGADAVYLGVDNFNARAKCDNFNLSNIGDVIARAHLFGVKVYVTLNTLIADSEIKQFLSTVGVLYNAKADAFITQDIGMAMLIKKLYPSAVLHASTQMGIHNADGAEFLEKCGYKRVILSRETKLEDIVQIRERTNLEIEFFVQGALCVAFSGNCYLSSVKDGNSGNRGKCHQLCRLAYSCGKKRGYLLSPNDLCLIDKLKTLTDAGVTSFKIEGRMKRPSYVSAAVKAYRKAIDGADDEQVKNAVDLLSRTFSRGEYNLSAYLYNNDGIIDEKHNNNTGVFCGTVTNVKPFKELYRITVDSHDGIVVGDGLKFVGKNEVTIGVGTVEKVDKSAYTLVTARSGISVGDKVYKTLDKKLDQSLTDTRKFFPVRCHMKAMTESPLEMTLICGGVSVTEKGDVAQKAVKNSLDEEQLIGQLKYDSLPFFTESVTLETDGVFAAKSTLNAIRRKAVQSLTEAIIRSNSLKTSRVDVSDEERERAVNEYFKLSDKHSRRDEYVIIHDLSSLDREEKRTIFFAPDDYNKIENVPLTDLSADFYLNLPIIATNKDIAVIMSALDKLDLLFGRKVGVVANNYYALAFLGDRAVIAGAGLNIYNKVSGGFYLSLGVKDVIASGELPGIYPFAAYEANLPLMTLTHCPYKVSANSTCSDCKATKPLVYKDERANEYIITRYKMFYCYFELRLKDKKQYNALVPKNKKMRKVYEI